MPGGRCIFKRERKGDKFDFAYEKGDVSKGAHILRCAACRKDGYNAGLNAYQLKKCFDVGLRRMYRLYCIQNFFSPPFSSNYPSRKIRISLFIMKNIIVVLWYINFPFFSSIYKFSEKRIVNCVQIFCEIFSQI